jgi:hypothetical protein
MTFKCKFCKAAFVKESTLVAHTCEPKRRMSEKENKQNRIAYQAWLLFRKQTIANIKNDKPYEEFISNRYYTAFMKLAKRIIDLNIPQSDEFVKFLISNSVRMDEWTKDSAYAKYVKYKAKAETVDRAAERSIIHIKNWADRTGNDYREYFQKVSTVEFVHDLKMGRISPWCTFATDQGSRLIDRLDPVQVQELIDYLEPATWKVRVKRQVQDASWIQDIFNKAELL